MEEVPVQSARDVDNFFMSELQQVKHHPQETDIKFYDGKHKPAVVSQSSDDQP
jgi:hypothetical protein